MSCPKPSSKDCPHYSVWGFTVIQKGFGVIPEQGHCHCYYNREVCHNCGQVRPIEWMPIIIGVLFMIDILGIFALAVYMGAKGI